MSRFVRRILQIRKINFKKIIRIRRIKVLQNDTHGIPTLNSLNHIVLGLLAIRKYAEHLIAMNNEFRRAARGGDVVEGKIEKGRERAREKERERYVYTRRGWSF